MNRVQILNDEKNIVMTKIMRILKINIAQGQGQANVDALSTLNWIYKSLAKNLSLQNVGGR